MEQQAADKDWESMGFFKPRRPQPFIPEMWTNRPGPWKVVQGPPDNGSVDFHDKVVTVPFPYSHIQEGIRLHEGTHLAISPSTVQFASRIRRMVEEVSVDARASMTQGNITTSLDLTDTDHIIKSWEGSEVPPQDYVCWILQFAGCGYDHDWLNGTFTDDTYVHWSDLPSNIERFLDHCENGLSKQVPKKSMKALWDAMCEIWQHPGSVALNDAIAERLGQIFPNPSETEVHHVSYGKYNEDLNEQYGQRGQGSSDSEGDGSGREHPGKPTRPCNPIIDSHTENDQVSQVRGEAHEGRKTRTRKRVVPSGEGKADVFTEARSKVGEPWKYVPGSIHETRSHEAKQAEHTDKVMKKVLSMADSNAPLQEGDEQHWEKLIQDSWERLDRDYDDVKVEFTLDTMSVEDLTLCSGKSGEVAGTWRNSEFGNDLANLIEYYGDGRMYRERAPGGSVIIDVSGSMRWDYEALRKTIEKLPTTVIAVYSGGGIAASAVSQVNGSMLVVAREGRWTDPQEAIRNARLRSSNGVDLEALEWLGQQPEPRVWLGDGEVHSGRIAQAVAEGGYEAVGACVRDLCRKYDIVRSMSVEDALQILNSGQHNGVTCWTHDAPGLVPVVEKKIAAAKAWAERAW